MARAKLYVRSENPAKRELRGQALQVMQELESNREPRLATDIDAAIQASNPFKTRQDTLRVTLYYLLVFKKQGLVEAIPQPVATEAASDENPATETAGDATETNDEAADEVAEVIEAE